LIPNHCIENNQQFTHTGGSHNFEELALGKQTVSKTMNNGIETHSTQNGHIKDTANVFSATPDMGLPSETSGAEIIRSYADQGSNFLTVELAEFWQSGQQDCAGLRSNAWGALEDFVFLAEVLIGLDVLLDEFIEFGNLVVKDFDHLADAFANFGMADGLATIQLLGAQVNKLATAANQVGQFVRFGAGLRFGLRLDDLSETGKDACVDWVGLGKFTDATCEVTDLAWRGDDDLELCLKQFSDNGTFIAAGCFKDYKCDAVILKGLDKLVDARRRVGHRQVDGGRAGGDVKCVFGDVDTDE